MSRVWPLAVAICGLIVIGIPLALPFAGLALTPDGWSGLKDLPRLVALAGNTLALAASVVLIDLPLGIGLAVLLYRSDLAGRVALRRLLALSLFVPLPFVTTAWQAAFDLAGRLTDVAMGGWRPWLTGLPMAVWVHAVAGLVEALRCA